MRWAGTDRPRASSDTTASAIGGGPARMKSAWPKVSSGRSAIQLVHHPFVRPVHRDLRWKRWDGSATGCRVEEGPATSSHRRYRRRTCRHRRSRDCRHAADPAGRVPARCRSSATGPSRRQCRRHTGRCGPQVGAAKGPSSVIRRPDAGRTAATSRHHRARAG